MIRACVNEGTAILRTGWNHKVEEVTEEVPNFMMVEDPTFAEQLQQIMQMMQQKPDFLEDQPEEVKLSVQYSQQAGVPIRVYKDGTRIETKQKVIANHPTVDVVDFNSIYVDPTCQGDLSKAQFIIHKFDTREDAENHIEKQMDWDMLVTVMGQLCEHITEKKVNEILNNK